MLSPQGAGGIGEVYRARDPRLGRDVARLTLRAPRRILQAALAALLILSGLRLLLRP